MAEVSLAAARALLSRVNTLEDEAITEGILITLRNDPDWLQLPPAKRETALTRYKALRAYDRKNSPTKADAVAAAAGLGIQLRSFYSLLRRWRDKDKSIFALIPYRSEAKAPRPSRLHSAIADQLNEQVHALLKKDPSIAPGKAVSAIEDAWPTSLRRPSAVTIRAFLERVRELNPAEPGSMRLHLGTSSKEEAVTASRFGEIIVIDHTAPARLLLDGETAMVPTLTFAIDLFTGVAIGAAVSEQEPNPEAVLDALADAQERMNGLGKNEPIQPRIVYASTTTIEWNLLREELVADGLDLVEQRDHRLHFGGPTKRFIGNKLGGIPLQASKVGRPGVDRIDAQQDALLTMNQMQFVINSAIDRLIKERLPEMDGSRGARLQLPARLVERGGLKARTKPLIDLTGDGDEHPKAPHVLSSNGTIAGEAKDRAEQGFSDGLRDLVEDVVGRIFVQVEVHEPTAASPGWLVRVEIRDRRHLPEVWLRLAREAVKIAEADGERVRFEVVVLPAPERDTGIEDGDVSAPAKDVPDQRR